MWKYNRKEDCTSSKPSCWLSSLAVSEKLKDDLPAWFRQFIFKEKTKGIKKMLFVVKECTQEREKMKTYKSKMEIIKGSTFISTVLIVISVISCITESAKAVTATIDVKAYIDGRDWLIISGNTLQWHHFDYAAVGRHEGLNEPTIISTKLEGNVVMDQVNWLPQWPEEPPAEIRYEAFSSIFTDLIPNIPLSGMIISDVTLTPILCRSSMSLIEFNPGNIIIEFNDNQPYNPDWYEAQIDVTMIPEPATICLLGIGGLVTMRRRGK
jgi:hypothetical protein